MDLFLNFLDQLCINCSKTLLFWAKIACLRDKFHIFVASTEINHIVLKGTVNFPEAYGRASFSLVRVLELQFLNFIVHDSICGYSFFRSLELQARDCARCLSGAFSSSSLLGSALGVLLAGGQRAFACLLIVRLSARYIACSLC